MIQSDTYRKNPVIANPPFGGCGNLFCAILILLLMTLIGCHSDPISTSGEPQPTIVGGTITSDTTWRAADGPYHVIEDLTICDSVNWTVEPGTDIVVDWKKAIRSRGITMECGKDLNSQDIIYIRMCYGR